jgi:hypothetical protein
MSQYPYDRPLKSRLNVTSSAVIKSGAGRFMRIIVVSGGTTNNGSFVFNDSATVAGAATSNQIYAIPAGTAAGTVIDLNFPVVNGVTVSAVPTAGSPQLSISYF